MNREMPGLPMLNFHMVDVRDCAEAHILAMENPKSDGERILLCSNKDYWLADVAGFLEKEFKPQGSTFLTVADKKLAPKSFEILLIFGASFLSAVRYCMFF